MLTEKIKPLGTLPAFDPETDLRRKVDHFILENEIMVYLTAILAISSIQPTEQVEFALVSVSGLPPKAVEEEMSTLKDGWKPANQTHLLLSVPNSVIEERVRAGAIILAPASVFDVRGRKILRYDVQEGQRRLLLSHFPVDDTEKSVSRLYYSGNVCALVVRPVR
jgi:hypothetical protein